MALPKLSLPPEISEAFDKFVDVLLRSQGEELRGDATQMARTADPGHLTVMSFKLVNVLRERNDVRRDRAAQVLAVLGPRALPELIDHVYASRNTDFRLELIELIAGVGPTADGEVFWTLQDLSFDRRDPAVRRAARMAIPRLVYGSKSPSATTIEEPPAPGQKHEPDDLGRSTKRKRQ